MTQEDGPLVRGPYCGVYCREWDIAGKVTHYHYHSGTQRSRKRWRCSCWMCRIPKHRPRDGFGGRLDPWYWADGWGTIRARERVYLENAKKEYCGPGTMEG